MKELGIFCYMQDYSKRLADYLIPKIDQEFCVVIYSDEDELYKGIEEGRVNTLLTENRKWSEFGADIKKSKIKKICLVEEKEMQMEDITCIYKYYPASALIPEIVSFCNVEETIKKENYENCKITSIYSPIGGVGSTSFSIAFSEIKGKKHKVLYLCLEPFSAVAEMLFLDDKTTITEAIYAYMTNSNESYDIGKYIQSADGYDIILPSRSYVELNSIQIDKLKEWIIYIKSKGIYTEIVVELSDSVNSFVEVFDICDKIVILHREGIINKRKLEIFERELSMELSEKMCSERVVYINVPELEGQDDTYESLEETEMGRWMKGIIGTL